MSSAPLKKSVRFSDTLDVQTDLGRPSASTEIQVLIELGKYLEPRVTDARPVIRLFSGRRIFRLDVDDVFASAHLTLAAIDQLWEQVGPAPLDQRPSAQRSLEMLFDSLRQIWEKAHDQSDQEEIEKPVSFDVRSEIAKALETAPTSTKLQRAFTLYWEDHNRDFAPISTTTKRSAPLKSILKSPGKSDSNPDDEYERPDGVIMPYGFVFSFYQRIFRAYNEENWHVYYHLLAQPRYKNLRPKEPVSYLEAVSSDTEPSVDAFEPPDEDDWG